MSIRRGPVYTSVSQITGPTGFYRINLNNRPVTVYVDQSYDGGGWVLVLANRINTGGMNNLTRHDAINTCNYRTGGSSQGANTTIHAGGSLNRLGISGVNVFIGANYWGELSGRASSGKTTIVQFVAPFPTYLSSTNLHTKRYRWRSDGFGANYQFTGVTALSDETGTGTPGFYSYHAANGFGLTTYDNDLDPNGGNCSTYYNNNPWWYGSCWSGNYFAGNGYVDGPYWDSSVSDYHNYGAVYIK